MSGGGGGVFVVLGMSGESVSSSMEAEGVVERLFDEPETGMAPKLIFERLLPLWGRLGMLGMLGTLGTAGAAGRAVDDPEAERARSAALASEFEVDGGVIVDIVGIDVAAEDPRRGFVEEREKILGRRTDGKAEVV